MGQNQPKSANAKLGCITKCPNCGRNFNAASTHGELNAHLDRCLATQQNQNPIVQPQHKPTNLLSLQNHTQNPDDEFIWNKIKLGEEEYKWVKVKCKKNIDINGIKNMQNHEILKLPFEEKVLWFRTKIEKYRISWKNGADNIHVTRNNILEDSINGFKHVNLFKEVKIIFDGEPVQDAGGLFREWTHLLVKEMFSKTNGFFVVADTNNLRYKINPNLEVTAKSLEAYEFFGKFVGKTLFERIPINIYFDRCLIKHMIDSFILLDDLKYLDEHFYHSLLFIKNNDLNKEEPIGETFCHTKIVNGQVVICEMIPDGRNIELTEDNKQLFIEMKTEWISKNITADQLNYFLNGFHSIVDKKYLRIFTPEEFEMILNGVPFIDVKDWQENTIYKGSYYRGHTVVKWFWSVVETWNQDQLSKLLQFSTGSQRTPVEGFRALESNRGELQRFCINSLTFDEKKPHIVAHTCFNRLDVPMYNSFEKLKQYLEMILQMDFEGFFGVKDQLNSLIILVQYFILVYLKKIDKKNMITDQIFLLKHNTHSINGIPFFVQWIILENPCQKF